MKIYILAVLLALYPVPAFPLEVTLSWDEHDSPDLDYYTLYQAEKLNGVTGPWVADQQIGKSSCGAIVNVEDGKNFSWYLTATDASGNESGASNTVDLYDRIAPHAPINLRKAIGETQP